MDFITPSLCYQIVVIDRACIAADIRTERLKLMKASILDKRIDDEQMMAAKAIADEITADLLDIKLSAQSVATPVNEAISKLSLGENSAGVVESANMAAEYFKYSVARFISVDAKMEQIRQIAQL
jgi:hypothetical protein